MRHEIISFHQTTVNIHHLHWFIVFAFFGFPSFLRWLKWWWIQRLLFYHETNTLWLLICFVSHLQALAPATRQPFILLPQTHSSFSYLWGGGSGISHVFLLYFLQTRSFHAFFSSDFCHRYVWKNMCLHACAFSCCVVAWYKWWFHVS